MVTGKSSISALGSVEFCHSIDFLAWSQVNQSTKCWIVVHFVIAWHTEVSVLGDMLLQRVLYNDYESEDGQIFGLQTGVCDL